MNEASAEPKRGEVWRVDFGPSRGAEIRKTCPAVVINVATAGRLPLRVIVPLTEWHPAFERAFWHVRIEAAPENGLVKTSSADCFQVRSFSTERFVEKVGALTPQQVQRISLALSIVLGATEAG